VILKVNIFQEILGKHHKPVFGAREIFKYIGPGLLVTVGFIDPGNWASNIAAGSQFGYALLWVITLSTVMLIILQHNVAHLGIATGYCLSEATNRYIKKSVAKPILISAIFASISTAIAEILGGAIAINMLFHVPLNIGAVIVTVVVTFLLLSNSYRRLEKWIIGFVSIIGISFIYELFLVNVPWAEATTSFVIPSFPHSSIFVIMSLLGAVVMPHNLFLHSEVIQSRQWNLENSKVIKKQLDYEFADTLLSMFVGWAINGAMIIVAAAVFFNKHIIVTDLSQAEEMLHPLLGHSAAIIFAVALLFAGVASSITAGIAGGSVFAGLYGEPYNIKDSHTKIGVGITYLAALLIIFLISNPFQGLIISQVILSIQLPFTIVAQIFLTSSKKVMGKYANTLSTKIILIIITVVVIALNIWLLFSLIQGLF